VTYAAGVAGDLDDTVLSALGALLLLRKTEPRVLAAKRQALAAVAGSGVPKRRVSETVCAILSAHGWTPEDIAAVGVSAPQVRADLGRVLP
jgi:hypothetical protein